MVTRQLTNQRRSSDSELMEVRLLLCTPRGSFRRSSHSSRSSQASEEPLEPGGNQYPEDYTQSSSFFASYGRILEITDGSLGFLSDQLRSSSFKFVLFYAPWCAQSKRAAVGFNKAANLLKDEVKFIAINCWTGTCRQDHVLDSFPKMFAYHSGFNGVQYMGGYDPWQMVRFIHSIIKPIAYVGRMHDFVELKGGAKGFVVSYFNSTALESKNYSVYFSVALQSVGKASSPLFTLVTNQELAEEVGISLTGEIVFYRVKNPPIVYPSGANYTKAAILHWTETHSEELVVQLSASVSGKEHLARQLQRGPALILFLPLGQQKISGPLMDVYTHAARQFYNCSCNVSLHGASFTKSGNVDMTNTDTLESIEQDTPEKRQKVKKIVASETFASKGEKGSTFVASLNVQRYCRSVALQDSTRNVCDVCNTCQNLQGCSHLTNLKINLHELQKQFPANAVVTGKNCICLRNRYYHRFTINMCCVELTNEQALVVSEKSAQRLEEGAMESLMAFDVADVNGIIDAWTIRFKTLFQTSSQEEGLNILNVRSQIYGDRIFISGRRDVSPDGTANQDDVKTPTEDQERKNAESLTKDDERNDLDDKKDTPGSVENPDVAETQENEGFNPDGKRAHQKDGDFPSGRNSSCAQTGHVAEFRGAGCLSNKSLNFFYIDSRQHWVVAERLGLTMDESGLKTGLVIVDLKNEAQFVLDEALEITNKSVVEFMMGYMSGSLQRRFTSSRRAVSTCSTPRACVVEVTTATFDATVLDNSKDVLLLYYAPWCGYCVGLSPVYLTVARFFENITDVRIARINADENDLSYEFLVTHYPTFILYPAGRKDFSVRFPDSRERTAKNLIQFVLDHASKRARRAIYGHRDDDLCSKSDSYWAKIRELESRLQTTVEEKAFLEAMLQDAVKARDEAEQKWEEARKEIHEKELSTTKERQYLRVLADHVNQKLEERLKEAEYASFKAIAAGALFSEELELTKEKLEAKKEQLDELLLEKSQWSRNMRAKHLSLERAKRANSDLRRRYQALLRRLRQLEVSRKVFRQRTTHGKGSKGGECTSSHQEHSVKLPREHEDLNSDYNQATESEQRRDEMVDFPENADGFRERIPVQPMNKGV